MSTFDTMLYRGMLGQLDQIKIVDTHEHLQRESELPRGDEIHVGRFFLQYTSSDLISAGMPLADLIKIHSGLRWWWGDMPSMGLSNMDRWRLIKPWYAKARNTVYHDAMRISLREVYGVDDLCDETMEALLEGMQRKIRPGFTRQVLDLAGIDFAMNNPFGPLEVYNPDYAADCFVVDMVDNFSLPNMAKLCQESGREVGSLDDYLDLIDWYFDRDGKAASAFKVMRAYDRSLSFADVPRSQAEAGFASVLAGKAVAGSPQIAAMEDFLMHTLCRKCGEYGLRMKFHTGHQEGNANTVMNTRAGLLINLFQKYPKTNFDIYHISYPYQQEAIDLTKTFPNVTLNFCFAWLLDRVGCRQALSQALDAVPASKIHGFGGDYVAVENVVGHSRIARREIARVLAEKVEDGRFDEDEAVGIGKMLLRDNAMENFGLQERRAAFEVRSGQRLGG